MISDSELCRRYDVACYQVKELPFPHDAEDANKYVVTTLDGTFENRGLSTQAWPLCEELAEAESLAVKNLKLREKYARDLAQLH